MSLLYNGDCNELMSEIDDESVDLIFTDLPYGQVSCEWDKKIDLSAMWDQFLRIKKLRTPIFFCCSTKFGVELINSAPKKCPFRYDIVWVKSAPAGFLSAKKMPMRKHEMLYVFYEKLPFYDLSSHSHKFKNALNDEKVEKTIYGRMTKPRTRDKTYDPSLPVSVQKEETYEGIYSTLPKTGEGKNAHSGQYDPPLPVSVQKEDNKTDDNGNYIVKKNIYRPTGEPLVINRGNPNGWTSPLPVSVQKEDNKTDDNGNYELKGIYNGGEPLVINRNNPNEWTSPLPVSVQKEATMINGTLGGAYDERWQKGHQGNSYDPPLPQSVLEIKSQRGKHSTQKPTGLMTWVLKYYSKEGDVVLDPTMGSGSTGVACGEMKRNFIGIEMNPEIFEVACERLNM